MVSMLKRATGCDIMVGQNGLIWLNGEPEMEALAIRCIKLIEDNSNLQGLTQEIKGLLEELTGVEIE